MIHDHPASQQYLLLPWCWRPSFNCRREGMMSGAIIAEFATLVGDPARATIVSALLDGRTLTASELAVAARITPQTASSAGTSTTSCSRACNALRRHHRRADDDHRVGERVPAIQPGVPHPFPGILGTVAVLPHGGDPAAAIVNQPKRESVPPGPNGSWSHRRMKPHRCRHRTTRSNASKTSSTSGQTDQRRPVSLVRAHLRIT